MKTPTNELTGDQLNVAFCMALDIKVRYSSMQGVIQEGPIDHWHPFRPSVDITQLWRYIISERIEISPREHGGWQAQRWKPYGIGTGPSPEVAACRAVVNSVYGDEWETRIFPQ
jgi:hypothetical protein